MTKKAKKLNGAAAAAITDAFNRCFQIQMQSWKELLELQLHSAGLAQECANSCLQRLSTARNITDLMATESGLAAEYSTKFSGEVRHFYDTLSKSQQQLMECINQSGDMCQDLFGYRESSPAEETGEQSAKRQIPVS